MRIKISSLYQNFGVVGSSLIITCYDQIYINLTNHKMNFNHLLILKRWICPINQGRWSRSPPLSRWSSRSGHSRYSVSCINIRSTLTNSSLYLKVNIPNQSRPPIKKSTALEMEFKIRPFSTFCTMHQHSEFCCNPSGPGPAFQCAKGVVLFRLWVRTMAVRRWRAPPFVVFWHPYSPFLGIVVALFFLIDCCNGMTVSDYFPDGLVLVGILPPLGDPQSVT